MKSSALGIQSSATGMGSTDRTPPMMVVVALMLLASSLVLTAPAAPVQAADGFAAYNDLAWKTGQLEGNTTHITSPNGGSTLASTGDLLDFATGDDTGVNLTVTGGTFNGDSHADLIVDGGQSGEPRFRHRCVQRV